MIYKDSSQETEASGVIDSMMRKIRTCDGRRGRCGSVVLHADVVCVDCGKTYGRCDADGGHAGAMRSLHSHRGLHHPAVRR